MVQPRTDADFPDDLHSHGPLKAERADGYTGRRAEKQLLASHAQHKCVCDAPSTVLTARNVHVAAKFFLHPSALLSSRTLRPAVQC